MFIRRQRHCSDDGGEMLPLYRERCFTFRFADDRTCHRLRRKPLNQFTAEDLRVMIGQQVSPPILVPLAVERLEADPLVEGQYYPGDLLAAVLGIDRAFWGTYPDSLQRVRRVLARVRDALPTLGEIDSPTIRKLLEGAPPVLTENR
jgi:hypothetical protein